MNTSEAHEQRAGRHQRSAAAGAGAAIGTIVGGPVGGIVGAALGPLLEPWAEKVWTEVTADGRRHGGEVLGATCEASGRPIEDVHELIGTSDDTRLMAGIALSAASRTAWQDKVRTLGRSLASGLLAEDRATIDTEELIIAAIGDMEAPHLSLLELLCLRADFTSGSLKTVPVQPSDLKPPVWIAAHIATARPPLKPVLPVLLGTLRRHGLAEQNDITTEAIRRFSRELGSISAATRSSAARMATSIHNMPPAPSWSPTELGKQVLDRFGEAGAQIPDGWVSPPASPSGQSA